MPTKSVEEKAATAGRRYASTLAEKNYVVDPARLIHAASAHYLAALKTPESLATKLQIQREFKQAAHEEFNRKQNPSPGSLAARVAFGAVAPGATLALTAADIVDAVDQGLLDEAAGVVLKPMEMGGELVGRMVNPEFTSKHKGYYFYRIEYGKYAHHQPPPLPMDDWIVEADKAEQSARQMAAERGYPVEIWRSSLFDGKLTRVKKVKPPRQNPEPNSRQNPESAAATLFEKFHQTPSTEVVELAETIHEHDYLTTLGTLQTIKLHTLADKQVEIAFADDKPYLCSNETGTQLYIAGGDQTMDLKALGMGSKLWHKEHMLLGICLEVTYQTKKGFHDFQLTDYYHELGEETGVQPMLAYDTRNCKLSILGGQYQIKPEGITN